MAERRTRSGGAAQRSGEHGSSGAGLFGEQNLAPGGRRPKGVVGKRLLLFRTRQASCFVCLSPFLRAKFCSPSNVFSFPGPRTSLTKPSKSSKRKSGSDLPNSFSEIWPRVSSWSPRCWGWVCALRIQMLISMPRYP